MQALAIKPGSRSDEQDFLELLKCTPINTTQEHPLMRLHETGLPPSKAPMPLTTVIPIFRHLQCGTADRLMWIHWGRLASTVGDDMALAVYTAFIHTTKAGENNAGMSFGEVFRHGLGVYVWKHVGMDAPVQELSCLMQSLGSSSHRNPVLKCLLDPAHIERKLREVMVSVEIQEARTSPRSGKKCFNIAIVFLLQETMDVWHSANPLSPGHRFHLKRLRQQISKWKRTDPKIYEFAERVELPEHVESTVELEARLAEEKMDEEFSKLNFEDLLREEKIRRGLPPLAA